MKRYGFFKVKEGKLEQWKQWCDLLMGEHKDVALETMKYEHASREYYVLFTVGDTNYVVAAMEYFDAPRRADMNVPLNTEHKAMVTECLELLGTGESLCDLVVIK